MADVQTQTTTPYNPWDAAARNNELKSARDKTRQEIETQQADILRRQDEVTKEYYAELEKTTGSRIHDPQREQDVLNQRLAPYQNQLSNLRTKMTEIDQADKGLMPDGSPMRPEYFSLIDPKTGLMMDQYQLKVGDYSGKTIDPNSLEGMQAYKKEALRTGPSVYATLQQQLLGQKKNTDMDKAVAEGAAGGANARSQLAMRGGLNQGAALQIALQGDRNVLNAKQGVNRDYNSNNLQLMSDDEKNRLAALQGFTGMETNLGQFNTNIQNDASKFNIGNKAKADEYNITRSLEEKRAADVQDLEIYKEQQKKWAAERQATATQNSGSGGGGGCCFIFLEARYGNGVMDSVVRRFRDEMMTSRNQRGYYKLSEVLVPLMRKSRAIKAAVRFFMTDPMVSYGKYYYGENSHGFIFAPIKNFWLKTFDYLGLDHEFIRENGETV